MSDDEDSATVSIEALDTPVLIHVKGSISDEMVGQISAAFSQARDSKQETVVLDIHSPGGSCYSALAIQDIIQAWLSESDTRKLVTKTSMAFSSAFNLFLLGSTRVVTPRATLMSHDVQGGVEGELAQLVTNLREYKRVNSIFDAQIRDSLGEDVALILCGQGDVYLSASRAKELGIATHIGFARVSTDIQMTIVETAGVEGTAEDSTSNPPPPSAKRRKRRTNTNI